MSTSLNFRSNACPTCMVCLICTKIYGKDCSCQQTNLNKKQIGNSDNSKDPELEVSNTKDPELENEKEPNTTIPYDLNNIKNFGNIEEEILSHVFPEQWGKIELGHICYKISNTSKADHYDLKADGAITAFVAGIKCKKNIQLCVYRESNKANKRIRTLETELDMINILDDIKKRIYENLPTCDIHIQGCLISEDDRHLKLDNNVITLWACAISTKMPGVDEKTPPNVSSFDKTKY
ncbi:6758_t:CDS:2 [Cetraspora pellucida]|uniref:6758_t:CDS:1 n=1 Tax=Cetraspora pellucida TaxID=1433469 RepID=A0ACA9L248_9GLOM|nr:6758_t:CDS:2 [Cetraspora pellucida]